jgi:hypothetical protein
MYGRRRVRAIRRRAYVDAVRAAHARHKSRCGGWPAYAGWLVQGVRVERRLEENLFFMSDK